MIFFSNLNCVIIKSSNLSDPMNEHFGGPINISNSSNMMSQNSYSITQATYGKTSLPTSPYDGESSTYSELI